MPTPNRAKRQTITEAAAEIDRLLARLIQGVEARAEKAKTKTADEVARDYVAVRDVVDLLTERMKVLNTIKSVMQYTTVPKAFEDQRIKSFTLDDLKVRVTISDFVSATVVEDQKEAALEWLDKKGHGDIAQLTINSSTLSAFAKSLMVENQELPEDIFKVSTGGRASVTKVRG